MTYRADKDGWENSEFPIVCETCLGDNPYVRMTKASYDKECKICQRPFTVFRWKAGTRGRFKKTEICQVCARLKNVCQVCLLDLKYGLPVQVRDTAQASAAGDVSQFSVPKSIVNRDFFTLQAEKLVKDGQAKLPFEQEESVEQSIASRPLQKLRRNEPYYNRNRAHICSFYVKGKCNRGKECPFRHEMPQTGELAKQNFKDRYYGKDDPVAKKMMKRVKEFAQPKAPDDPSIKSLYMGGVDAEMTDAQVREVFTAYGDVSEVQLLPQKRCGFITFASRKSAEDAIGDKYDRLEINGSRLKLMWKTPSARSHPAAVAALPLPQAEAPSGGNGAVQDVLVAPPGMEGAVPQYSSMDPRHVK